MCRRAILLQMTAKHARKSLCRAACLAFLFPSQRKAPHAHTHTNTGARTTRIVLVLTHTQNADNRWLVWVREGESQRARSKHLRSKRTVSFKTDNTGLTGIACFPLLLSFPSRRCVISVCYLVFSLRGGLLVRIPLDSQTQRSNQDGSLPRDLTWSTFSRTATMSDLASFLHGKFPRHALF